MAIRGWGKRAAVTGVIAAAVAFLGFEVYVLSPDTRALAARTAGRVGAWDTVAGMLDDQESDVRSAAGDTLADGGAAAVPALVRGLTRLAAPGRQAAAVTLARMKPAPAEAIPALMERLRADPDAEARTAFAWALATVAPDDPRVVGAVGGLLAEGDERGRATAAEILGKMGPPAAAAVPALAAALRDADVNVRREAAEALGRIGPAAAAAVPALSAALGDAEPEVRMEAAEALGSLGPAARGAVPALTAALRDAHPKVRSEAAEALGKIK